MLKWPQNGAIFFTIVYLQILFKYRTYGTFNT